MPPSKEYSQKILREFRQPYVLELVQNGGGGIVSGYPRTEVKTRDEEMEVFVKKQNTKWDQRSCKQD